MKPRKRKNQSGFTLIELLLSLAIFVLIGLATTRHIQQVQQTKNLAFDDLDLYNDLRTAISMLRSDLSQAFHILYDDLGDENKQALLQNQQVAHTLFDGRKSEMVLTSLSHRVYYQGRRECEQTEISYFLQNKQGAKYPSLMKRESDIVDADLYNGGPIYTVLENVVSLEFEYWDEKASRWVQDWSSDGGAYRDHFPYSVKVKLEVARPSQTTTNELRLKLETQIKIAFPNNDLKVVQF